MQTRTASSPFVAVIRFTKITAALAVIIYLGLAFLDKVYPEKFSRCDRYTKLLNGGEKRYGERRLNVVLCGTGPDKNWMNDKIRLQIFSDQKILLAQGTFHVDWDTNSDRELIYGANRLTYFDSSQSSNYAHSINMPPTWWDWVKARIPLMS